MTMDYSVGGIIADSSFVLTVHQASHRSSDGQARTPCFDELAISARLIELVN